MALLVTATACNQRTADTLVIGNIITMDSTQPHAEAMTIKDGKVQFVGDLETARKYVSTKTQTCDYGTNTVYPGFCESHAPVYCIDENEKDVDGVIEAHTGWLLEPYSDQSDYYGLKRGEDAARIEKIVRFANEHGLYVHFHAIGDGAVKTAVDAICAAEDQTGIKDARNIIAHLQVVRPEEIKKMGQYDIMAAVAPLWVTMGDEAFEQMVGYIGEQRAWGSYPIKSFFDAGVKTTFHTDYPVSPGMSIPNSVYNAVTRTRPDLGMDMQKNPEECITREQSLEAMTLNPAYQWRQEGRLGCLKSGMVANYTVYDTDFLDDDLDRNVSFNRKRISAIAGY